VVVVVAGEVVADHPRSLAKHRTIVDPAHVAARTALRALPSPPADVDGDVEIRDLAVYDRALGVA
jgi:hypothetical protein